ncbi:MAG: branched-chain amino acid ABC transporter permease [Thermodesulfobacteriota bacterium]
MTEKTEHTPTGKGPLRAALAAWFAGVPLLGLLLGALVSVLLELLIGEPLARSLGLPKVPVLFGVLIILKTPLLFPSSLLYVVLIYVLPVSLVARLTRAPANALAAGLMNVHLVVSVAVHLGLLYAALHIWSGLNEYRLLTVKLTLIAIMMTLSLNVINGYMGEFSCSHPGFMALGAYVASIITLLLFVDDRVLGPALVSADLGPWAFPLALVVGGLTAALGALIIAIPSFRTRGDYLAIISLAFLFIVKSLVENLEVIGGPRGLMGQPDYANLPTVFAWTVVCIWIINNFVRSTLGKALNAVRDDEIAAEAMTVNTRRTKMVAFMFGAFWAGVAGGLFAHVIRFINPATFGLQKLAEALAMVYFGGLNSVYGSVVGAVSISLLGEALRPLEIFKWIVIPLLLILVMIYRPTGLIAFREFDVRRTLEPKGRPAGEV